MIFQVDYSKYTAVNLATSHPHYDSAGNILNMGTSIVDKGKTKYVIFKIPPSVPGKILLSSILSRNLLAISFLLRLGGGDTALLETNSVNFVNFNLLRTASWSGHALLQIQKNLTLTVTRVK